MFIDFIFYDYNKTATLINGYFSFEGFIFTDSINRCFSFIIILLINSCFIYIFINRFNSVKFLKIIYIPLIVTFTEYITSIIFLYFSGFISEYEYLSIILFTIYFILVLYDRFKYIDKKIIFNNFFIVPIIILFILLAKSIFNVDSYRINKYIYSNQFTRGISFVCEVSIYNNKKLRIDYNPNAYRSLKGEFYGNIKQ